MTSRVRIGALVLALALVGACSSGGKDDNKASASDTKRTTTTDLADEFGLATTTTTPGATTSTVKGATTTTVKGATTTTAKPGGATPVTTAAPVGEAAPAAAANGTYTYSQSGSTPDGPVPPTGTLVVSNPTYSRYYDQSKAPQRLAYQFRDNGAFITGATLSFNGASANCSLGNGLAAPPWPATGSDSASGTCSTPIGPLTVVATSHVSGRSGDIVSLSITVHAYNANKSIDVTLNDTEGWSISKRIPKTSHQVFSGTALGNPVNGNVTSTLQG